MLKKYYYIISLLITLSFSSQIRPLYAYENDITCSPINKSIQFKTLFNITNLAQVAIWLNEEDLVIGRWDGTITIFSSKDSPSILQAFVSPTKHGITMLERINDFAFVSSNGPSSIALWEQNNQEYFLKDAYIFNDCFGSADSARLIKIENEHVLLTGHSEGYLVVWKYTEEGLSILNSINLQSNCPLDSPYKLSNIRNILPWKNQIIITASEDGDLCMVDAVKGAIIHRQKFNKNAKRGINNIFILGDYLLLSNCSVGPSDRNLWLYRIEENKFTYLDSKNLVKNKNLNQVFSFGVVSISYRDKTYFFCSTEEGLLWFGQIENDTLQVSSFRKISSQVGAVLAMHPLNNRIASISYNVELLEFFED